MVIGIGGRNELIPSWMAAIPETQERFLVRLYKNRTQHRRGSIHRTLLNLNTKPHCLVTHVAEPNTFSLFPLKTQSVAYSLH